MNKNQYTTYDKADLTKEILNTIEVGDLIKINTWGKPKRVIAVSENFVIMWRNHFSSWQYSILEKNKRGHARNLCYQPDNGYDEDEFVCGPDDHYCAYYYNDPSQAEEALLELESGELEVSTRNGWGVRQIAIKKGKHTHETIGTEKSV